jgi:hypothetical protein
MEHRINFTINVDYLGDGEKGELEVYPANSSYHITLDGVAVTTIQHKTDDDTWEQLDGNLDEEAIARIGDAIESHYM